MDMKEHIGSKVREGRKRRRLTQEQLAEAVEKAVETISNIERGHAYTGLETLERIGQVLEMPVRDFFEDVEKSANLSKNRVRLEETARTLAASLTDRELSIALDLMRSIVTHRT